MKLFTATVAAVLLLAVSAHAAPSDSDRCVAAKLGAAAKRFSAISNCRAKAVLAGAAVDPDCIAKAEQKFFDAFTKAEASGACPFPGDSTTIDGYLAECTALIGGDIAYEGDMAERTAIA